MIQLTTSLPPGVNFLSIRLRRDGQWHVIVWSAPGPGAHNEAGGIAPNLERAARLAVDNLLGRIAEPPQRKRPGLALNLTELGL